MQILSLRPVRSRSHPSRNSQPKPLLSRHTSGPKQKKRPRGPFGPRGRFALRAGRYSGSYLTGLSRSAKLNLSAEPLMRSERTNCADESQLESTTRWPHSPGNSRKPKKCCRNPCRPRGRLVAACRHASTRPTGQSSRGVYVVRSAYKFRLRETIATYPHRPFAGRVRKPQAPQARPVSGRAPPRAILWRH